ncbi:uncharacterized protein ACR2FA_002870 [Aphomia sociella]
MRRKEQSPPQGTGRGKSLIAMRTNQQQQRRMPTKSFLPRSYSSPASNDPDVTSPQTSQIKGYVMRSFSSPEPKHVDYRRNSDSFYRPKTHGSRGELDSDLENFEPFEECFLDIDEDQDDNIIGTLKRSPERDQLKKVTTSILPGSGLQRITIRPISSSATQTLQSARDAIKKIQKDDKFTRLNFRPLVLKMPARYTIQAEHEEQGVEELQSSPQLELEAAELERELDNAEQHLEKEIAIATEESDADTI